MDEERLVEAAGGAIAGYTADQNAVLIFAAGIHHGRHVVELLRDRYGIECGFVCGGRKGGSPGASYRLRPTRETR